jgi:hypothetical protein
MAALSIHLEEHANYDSTLKHAESVMRLLTNANFRSLFMWLKEEQKNKRDNMDYDVIESVPVQLRVYIMDQTDRLGEIYNIRRMEISARNRPEPFNKDRWLGKVRSTFGVSNGHAYLKQAMVRLSKKFNVKL